MFNSMAYWSMLADANGNRTRSTTSEEPTDIVPGMRHHDHLGHEMITEELQGIPRRYYAILIGTDGQSLRQLEIQTHCIIHVSGALSHTHKHL